MGHLRTREHLMPGGREPIDFADAKAEARRSHEGRLAGTERRRVMGIEKRGFASMDRSKQREIASKGGKTAHAKGAAYEWTPGCEAARAAGRKGGAVSRGGREKVR
jgi:uncharacterized protein